MSGRVSTVIRVFGDSDHASPVCTIEAFRGRVYAAAGSGVADSVSVTLAVGADQLREVARLLRSLADEMDGLHVESQ